MKEEELVIIDPIPRSPISQPDLSPDGEHIVFKYRVLNKGEDRYENQIWMASIKDGESRPFTYAKGDSSPKWSPKADYIMFLSDRELGEVERMGSQIWLIPFKGGEARPLTKLPGGVLKAFWSPTGDRILFLGRARTREEGKRKEDLRVIDKLNYKGDGAGFYTDTRVHLFTVDMEGETQQLSEGDYDVVTACWSPEGEEIAFVANMSLEGDCTPMKDIWIIPSSGGEAKRIVEDIATRGSTKISWSPDGRLIAYTCMNPVNPDKLRHQYTNIWVKPVEEGEEINLTAEFDRTVSRSEEAPIRWTPDSKEIYFISHSHGTSHLHRVGMDKIVDKITEGEETIQSFSVDGDSSRIVYCSTTATKLPEIYLREDGETKQVTSLTSPMIEGLPLSEPETFWFKASDGSDVQGWIMKPAGFEEGERYPTLLQIHGGPWSNYGYQFSSLFQHLSANGFVVVYVNHRASTGYGYDFAKITGRWGDREYKDLMEAMNYVIGEYPYIDTERLGVGGCSGGGYLTNWIVTHTNRFKSAVTVASISNWLSFYGCSDLGPCHILNFWDLALGKEPWEDPDAYLKPSPISYADKVETPLLILHGEEDFRCPMEQAEQLFAALKKQGKEVRLIRFPGESHAHIHTMKKPSHTTGALKYTLEWYKRYL
ncbi:MAG: S9 family peptidase [Candidatus Bathyarchaeia archaeon]